MKVLHIFNEIKYSGAEIMYANAAPLFQEKGIHLLALSTGENVGDFSVRFDQADIQIVHKPLANGIFNPLFLLRYFKQIRELIKSEKIDVMHIHRSSYYSLFSFVGFIAGIRCVRTVHNVFTNRKITWLKAVIERLICRNVFGLVFHSIGESVYQNELKYYKNPSIKINNWYDAQKFYPALSDKERNNIRESLSISTESLVIISTGGCSRVKNHHDIVRAMALINKKVPCIYIHLGTGCTESEEIELAKSLGVYKNIRFLSNKTDVRKYLIASDIYLMPSLYEGLGNAALEAMACGITSILYNVPGLKDLINHDDNGFIIDPNYKSLAETVIFCQANQETSKLKGINALNYIKLNYSMSNGVNAIVELYQ